jgi:hypothetical protein
MHSIYLGVSPLHIVIDHMEQGREEPPKPTPIEDTNPEQDQGKKDTMHLTTFVELYLSVYLTL